MIQWKGPKNNSQHGAVLLTNKRNRQIEVKTPTPLFITSFNLALNSRCNGG